MTGDDFSHRVIKSYEVHECIGAGGFGAVYRAFQPSVSREVAIKVILPQHANQPDFIRRFEVEAQLIARLEHPHIVPLYDYWRGPEGAFLVMRWLPGNLRDALKKGPWSTEATARLLDQLASALALAHREGVVHRDIKPDNILLDEDDNAYLADFGIAKDTNVGTSTEEGALVGSPAYITPEQIKGEPVTPRADIYTLGLVIYETLAGERPFADAATPMELISRHLNTPLPPLPSHRANLPATLNEVLQTATAKNPDHRYATMQRFAASFRAALPNMQRAAVQPLLEPLTDRELEILRLMSDGLSNAEIVERLVLTAGTVKWYVNRIYAKLDVHSRRQAIERARQLGLFQPTREEQPEATAMPSVQMPQVNRGHTEDMVLGVEAITNPYKGLRAFQETDAADFFGRAALTEQLLARLAEEHEGERFLAVVGPSGSGKSSVVRAGLIPALRRGGLPNSARWFITDMLPGTHPLEELEAALLRVSISPLPGLRDELAEDRRGLVRAAKRLLPGDQDVELVLVIDQFEELFTLVDDEAVRTHFINNLLSAATDPRSRIRIILTLRADFYDRPLNYPRLAELMRSHAEIILPMTTSELERAIAGPAERLGLRFEPGLVAAMIADVSTQPGALPLLEYALTELFERRQDVLLTMSTYRESGGLAGALARRAEELYDDLEADGQAAARQIFLRLVTPGEGTEDTRRRVLQAELQAGIGESHAVDEVLALFGKYRLLTFDRDPLTHGPTVEVAHEALIREWARLQEWLADSREELRIHQRLRAAVTEWLAAQQEASFLAAGARLTQFEALAESGKIALSTDEQVYLAASLDERERLSQQEQARQAHELDLARQATASAQQAEKAQHSAANRLRYIALVLVLALVGALGLTGVAVNQQQIASNNAATATVAQGLAVNYAATSDANLKRSESQRLAAVANGLTQQNENSIELVALLSIKAAQLDYSPETDTVLQQATLLQYNSRIFTGHSGAVRSLAFSPDGKFALSGSNDKTARLWDLQTGQEVRQFIGHTQAVTQVAFSPNGAYVITGGEDGTVRVWDTWTGQELRQFSGGTVAVTALAVSPDGKYVLTGHALGQALLWNLETGSLVREHRGRTDPIRGVAFSADGKRLFSASFFSNQFQVLVWDTETGDRLTGTKGQTREANAALVLSPDARFVITVGIEGSGTLWDVQTGVQVRSFANLSVDAELIMGLSPDGKSLFVSNMLYDMQTGMQVRQFIERAGDYVKAAAFSADSQQMLTGSMDGSLRLWPLSMNLRRLTAHMKGVTHVQFSMDGSLLLTADPDTVQLWDAQSRRPIKSFPGSHLINYSPVALPPDGRYLLVPELDGFLHLRDVQTGADVRRFKLAEAGGYGPIMFAPGGDRFLASYVGSGGSYTSLIDLQTGFELRRVSGSVGAVSPDSTLIVTGLGGVVDSAGKTLRMGSVLDNVARLWNAKTGQEIGRLVGHTDQIILLGFSPDAKYIFTGSTWNDYSIRIWDTQTQRLMHTFNNAYLPAAFSPDGRMILAPGYLDRMLYLWDVQSGSLLQQFRPTGQISRLAFSPDGQEIVIGIPYGTVEFYFTDYRNAIRYLCSAIHRDFSEEERQQFNIPQGEPTCPQFGSQTSGLSPVWTAVPTQALPVWTPLPSFTPGPTPTPTYAPTIAFVFPPTPTYAVDTPTPR